MLVRNRAKGRGGGELSEGIKSKILGKRKYDEGNTSEEVCKEGIN